MYMIRETTNKDEYITVENLDDICSKLEIDKNIVQQLFRLNILEAVGQLSVKQIAELYDMSEDYVRMTKMRALRKAQKFSTTLSDFLPFCPAHSAR